MKRAVVAAVLLLALVWPPVHRLLAARFEWNPWKLGGFAMYTTPAPPVLAALFVREGRGLALLDESELGARARERLVRFRTDRHALGRLREPDDVARAVFAERPDLDHLLVVVQRMSLDPRTARMRRSEQRYVYDRAAVGRSAADPAP